MAYCNVSINEYKDLRCKRNVDYKSTYDSSSTEKNMTKKLYLIFNIYIILNINNNVFYQFRQKRAIPGQIDENYPIVHSKKKINIFFFKFS